MRDLCTIVTVETKNKMYQKDRICWITFAENGYEAIVPIEVNVGDKMVYIGEGSILPEVERWEFLRKRCYRESLHGFLISPMVMGAKDDNGEKGDRVKSWGLCVTPAEAGLVNDYPAGTDVTKLLDVIKYEPDDINATPTELENKSLPRFIKFCLEHKLLRWIGKKYLANKRKNQPQTSFPTDIICKSDETAIQGCKGLIKEFLGTPAYITAKLEGQSFTCGLDPKTKKLYICSRNNRYNSYRDAAKSFFQAAAEYDIEAKLLRHYKQTKELVVLQGEQCGPGIQGNIYNLDKPTWFLFRAKRLVDGSWEATENYDQLKTVANDFGIKCVPLICETDDLGKMFDVEKTTETNEAGETITNYNTNQVIDNLVKYAEAQYWVPKHCIYFPTSKEKLWKDYLQHEGIVVKSCGYDKEKDRGFSFKVKNCAYQEKSYSDMHMIAAKLM